MNINVTHKSNSFSLSSFVLIKNCISADFIYGFQQMHIIQACVHISKKEIFKQRHDLIILTCMIYIFIIV